MYKDDLAASQARCTALEAELKTLREIETAPVVDKSMFKFKFELSKAKNALFLSLSVMIAQIVCFKFIYSCIAYIGVSAIILYIMSVFVAGFVFIVWSVPQKRHEFHFGNAFIGDATIGSFTRSIVFLLSHLIFIPITATIFGIWWLFNLTKRNYMRD